jgi:starch synthase (maltosyl-transferring)
MTRRCISAAIFSDGHDHVAARLLWKHDSEHDWRSTPMTALAKRPLVRCLHRRPLGPWVFTIQAWVDHFDTWCPT